MMQSCASGDKLRDGGPILLRGCEPWCLSGQPPPRIANGTQSAEALRLATVDLPPVVDQLPLFSVLRWLCARRCPPAPPLSGQPPQGDQQLASQRHDCPL